MTEKQHDPVDVSQLRDITGIEKAASPLQDQHGWFWLWPALVLGLGLLLVAWRMRRRRRKPSQPPDHWALAHLDAIENQGLPARGEVERYHILLSDAIRGYLELRFQMLASRQTTPEFFNAVATSGLLTPAQKSLLSTFLERCDLAKFARAGFSAEECQAVGQMARTFVEQTAQPALQEGLSSSPQSTK